MTDADALGELIDSLEAAANADADPADTPDIGVIMGSDSDLETMLGAHDALTDLGFAEHKGDPVDSRFSFEAYVVSAHRTPALMETYARTAADRGLEVIIAGAGGKSADLPNMTASLAYPLPVIGIPIQEKSVDSVLGMPTGAPITAVDAGKSYNAALSAVQILARKHHELRDRLATQHARLQSEVAEDSTRLHRLGMRGYTDRGPDPEA